MDKQNAISPKERTGGRLMIVGTALLWGLAGVCVKSICWNSMSIMAVRSFVSLLLLAAVRKTFRVHLTKRNLLVGLCCAATGILYMMGIKNTNAATAIVLQYTAPILILVFGVLFRHQKPTAREIVIVLAVFGGCILSFADNMDAGHLLGNVLSLASGVTYALQIILFAEPETDSEDGMMLANIISVIVCTPFMFFDAGIAQTTPAVIFWIAVLCLLQYSLANILYVRGCQKVSDLECSLLLTLEPIFNPIPVAIICGEHMGPMALAGFAVVLTGIVVYTVSSKKEKNPAQPCAAAEKSKCGKQRV